MLVCDAGRQVERCRDGGAQERHLVLKRLSREQHLHQKQFIPWGCLWLILMLARIASLYNCQSPGIPGCGALIMKTTCYELKQPYRNTAGSNWHIQVKEFDDAVTSNCSGACQGSPSSVTISLKKEERNRRAKKTRKRSSHLSDQPENCTLPAAAAISNIAAPGMIARPCTRWSHRNASAARRTPA